MYNKALFGIVLFCSIGLSGLSTKVNAESPRDKYIKKELVKAKFWGAKKGELTLGFRMWEGEPDYPKSIVADTAGRIYILDHLNNRVVVCDSTGKYLREIPVNVYREATLEEMKKKMNGLAFPTLYASEMFIKDNVIYIPVKNGFFVDSKLVKIIKIDISKGWKVKEEKPSKNILNKINPKVIRVKGKEVRLEGGKTLKIIDNKTKEEKIINLPEDMMRSFIDREGNIYVTNHNYNYEHSLVMKYSSDGKELATIEIPFSVGTPFVRENGEIVALCRIPAADAPEFPSSSEGMKIVIYREE